MADFTVPDEAQAELGQLAELPRDSVVALIRELKAAEPALLLRQLAGRVASKTSMPRSDVLRALRLLSTMYNVLSRTGLAPVEFAEFVIGELGERIDADKRETFKDLLTELLSIDSLYVTARALEISGEHEHVLCGARILTDVRTVFDREKKPRAAVVIHMLKIGFHEGMTSDHKQFFVALTSEDLSELKEVIQRAEEKEVNLKEAVTKSPIRWLDPSGD